MLKRTAKMETVLSFTLKSSLPKLAATPPQQQMTTEQQAAAAAAKQERIAAAARKAEGKQPAAEEWISKAEFGRLPVEEQQAKNAA